MFSYGLDGVRRRTSEGFSALLCVIALFVSPGRQNAIPGSMVAFYGAFPFVSVSEYITRQVTCIVRSTLNTHVLFDVAFT